LITVLTLVVGIAGIVIALLIGPAQ